MVQENCVVGFKVVVTYPNKQLAKGVPMLISARGKEGNKMVELRRFDQDPNARDLTNELGEAEFVIDACSKCEAIIIQVLINVICSRLDNPTVCFLYFLM